LRLKVEVLALLAIVLALGALGDRPLPTMVGADSQAARAELVWRNTGANVELASTPEKPLNQSAFSFCIPPSADLPAGSLVQITEIRLASVNQQFSTGRILAGHYDASYVWLNGVRSDGVNGEQVGRGNYGKLKEEYRIASSATQSDYALVYRFSRHCVLVVGQDYPAAEGNNWDTGLALAWWNEKRLWGQTYDCASCRYRTSQSDDVIRSTIREGFSPVYEVRGVRCAENGRPVVTWADGKWSVTPRDGDAIRVELKGDSTVALPEDITCTTLELTGDGALAVKGGCFIVSHKLLVNGNARISSDGIDATPACIEIAAGSVLRADVPKGVQDASALIGPGTLVKTGEGELRLVDGCGHAPYVLGGGAVLRIEKGWVNIDGHKGKTTYGDATVELLPDGDLGCTGPQILDGKLTIVNKGDDDKLVFSGMKGEESVLTGDGTLVQKGTGGLVIGAACGIKGAIEVESYLTFTRNFRRRPSGVFGEGKIVLRGDSAAWCAADGLLLSRMTFNDSLADRGAMPLELKPRNLDPRNFVRSDRGRAYRLTHDGKGGETCFYGQNAPLPGGDFTLAIRARTEDRPNAVLISFGKMETGAFGLRTTDGGQIVYTEWMTNRIVRMSRPTTVARPSETYHVYALAYRADEKTMTLVADGKVVDTIPYAFGPSGGLFQFGSVFYGIRDGGATTHAENMFVDDFWICQRALEPARMAELFGDPPPAKFSFAKYVREHPIEFCAAALLLLLLVLIPTELWLRERQFFRMQTLFFSTVSHDIRTPLNAIVGFAELLDEDGVADVAERGEYLKTIRSSGKMLARLVNDVLDLAKLQSGKLEVVKEPTDVPQIIREVVASFEVIRARKSIVLKAEVDEMPRLVTDPQRLRQILFNLLGNAFKYTSEGTIAVRGTWREGTLALTVSDTGCGIPKGDQKRILKPFVQVADRNHRDGTGLGLPICTRLAKLLGGELTLESAPGKGSTFTVTLRGLEVGGAYFAQSQNPTRPAMALSKYAPPTSSARRHILVVDDSSVNLAVLKAMLGRCGAADILTATNGKEALAVLDEHPEIDLVFTDYWMPELDGAGLLRAIRANEKDGRHVTVCLVTADVDANKSYGARGFDEIILKPISPEMLAKIVGEGNA